MNTATNKMEIYQQGFRWNSARVFYFTKETLLREIHEKTVDVYKKLISEEKLRGA